MQALLKHKMEALNTIEIVLDTIEPGLKVFIDARKPGSLFDAKDDAFENNEARYQLVEGCFYDYEINLSGYFLGDIGENIILQHKRNSGVGTIAPNIFVGTLSIPVYKKGEDEKKGLLELEVQSIKYGYRDDYRDMLEFITEKCTDLLLQSNAPSSHYFDIDYSNNNKSLYQKFAFVQSVIGSVEFNEAVHRILTMPVTRWAEETGSTDIRRVRRFSNNNLKEILRGGQQQLSDNVGGSLSMYGLKSVPGRISSIHKTDSVDTPENRFVKHALETFLKFCTDVNSAAAAGSKLSNESGLLIRALETHLHHGIFKDISRPTTLKINSPILQRKEGYREVLRVWLMFELAAKLVWEGGDDIYKGGKKDIATLYEYWLFFQLLELLQSIFDIQHKSVEKLIVKTPDGLNLQLKQGRFTALEGVYDSGGRKLNIRFCYNRTFGGNKEYPGAGSWTTTLRPDYSLSFWPSGITEAEAEQEELIVHIHFDAKYKIANTEELFEKKSAERVEEEKTENRKGLYKNADLLKMHAYKDAIRRTGGAYILYPGDASKNMQGFHEIIPGLGAFPVRCSKTNNGTGELKLFIKEIIQHFINRASQREKLAYRVFDIFKNAPEADSTLEEPLPETYGINRGLLPDEVFVLVGFYKSSEHLEWIKRKGIYNFRTETRQGAIYLSSGESNAQFLLLHGPQDSAATQLWKLDDKGYTVYTGKKLLELDYPTENRQETIQRTYLVRKIVPTSMPELLNLSWNFKNLKNYQGGHASAKPFVTTLADLMRNTTIVK